MKIAIMQPYVFPYIGYFQLIHAVDTFVFYDDVNFIKQGWVNRNRILVNGKDYLFSIPVEQISSFTLIMETKLHQKNYAIWKSKFLKTVELNYKKAPFFNQVILMLDNILQTYDSIADLAQASVMQTAEYLQMERDFQKSSTRFNDTKGMNKADRLVEICKRLNGSHYINPTGGMELYNKSYFKARGIDLFFLKSSPEIRYQQFDSENFIPWLSIIDILMFNSKEEVKRMLELYALV